MKYGKYGITERFVAQQRWAERGGLVEQHEKMADEAVKRNDAEQQRLADIRAVEMYEFDLNMQAWREEHPSVPTEQDMIEAREYIKNAVAMREKARR